MSIDLHLSDKPFFADVTFKDGAHRRIYYTKTTMNGGFFVFYADAEGAEAVTFINTDVVASLEIDSATQTVGAVQ
jgi:copper(I)-binding protein